MMNITIGNIAENTGGRILKGTPGKTVSGVSTDTRELSAGEAFFAIRGDRFDPHDFLADAAAASVLIVEQPDAVPSDYDGVVIAVDDGLAAYQALSAWYKRFINPKCIAITGSVGKTTAKDMVAAAASSVYRTVATEGNFNNHIGVPKTIFRMEEDTEMLVLEMGMDHAGEIALLADIARPDVAIITNIGVSHRKNFDSDDGILNAKLEVATYFSEENTLFVNGDDMALRAYAKIENLPYEVVTVGESEGCAYRITPPVLSGEDGISFVMQAARNAIVPFAIPAAGLYNGVSAALASATLLRFGVELHKAAESLQELERTAHRLSLITKGGVKIIDDTYNASPDSMKSALDYLSSFDGHRKIAALAGMKELGKDSAALHRSVGAYAAEVGVDILIAIGKKGTAIAAGYSHECANGVLRGADGDSSADAVFGNENDKKAGVCGRDTGAVTVADNDEAIKMLEEIVASGDVILVKGSRAMKTEDIVNALKERKTNE